MHQVYIGSLILALVLAALTSVGGFAGRLGRRARRPRRLGRRVEDATHSGGGPAVLLLLLSTWFGAAGLAGEVLLPGLDRWTRTGVAAAVALVATALLAAAIRAYFRPVQDQVPFVGEPLIGAPAHVTVPIPTDGVGAVAYVVDGKRVTRPARAADAAPLPLKCPVRIVAVLRGTVVVSASPSVVRRSS